MDVETERSFEVITQWRLNYRRFRKNRCRGAVGEVSDLAKGFYKSDLQRILPVAQAHYFGAKKTEVTLETLQEPSPLHLHFGCGRLGLGLLLKTIIATGRPFMLLQSFKDEWIPILTGDTGYLTLKLNNDELQVRLFVHTLKDSRSPLALHQASGCQGSIVLVPGTGLGDPTQLVKQNCRSAFEEILLASKTMSCALGPGLPSLTSLLVDVLSGAKARGGIEEGSPMTVSTTPPPPADDWKTIRQLYACENDHNAVEKAAEALDPWTGVEVVPCMVDRICISAGLVQAADGGFEMQVKTEPWEGEIVVMHPRAKNCPFAGSIVRRPKVESQVAYFAQRKFLLVNGGHTTLAFLTMLRAKQDGINFTPPGDLDLLSWENMTEHEKATLWCFSICRCLQLIWQFDSEVLLDAHDGAHSDEDLLDELLEYAQSALRRFCAVKDTTKRVLAAGVELRFNGRLKSIEDFLNEVNPASTGLGRKMVQKTNLSYVMIASLVHDLVVQSSTELFPGRKFGLDKVQLPNI